MTTEDDQDSQQLTLFCCGPAVSCDHQWDGPEVPLYDHGVVTGASRSCSKCGISAFDATAWDD